MTKSPLPVNFLYLGGDKCGSTWLWHILSQHPDVTLANAKEIFYFDRFYDKGPEWYIRQFPRDPQTKRTGEVCHDYLYSETALKRIAEDMPADSRFLITTRNPVSRSVSHWKYLQKIGRTSVGFEEALERHPQIVEHSLFGKHVENAVNILGAHRVFVLDFDQLKLDASGFGRSLSEALDIPFVESLPYSDRVLEAQAARNPKLVALLRNTGWLIRSLGLPGLVSKVKSSKLVTSLLYTSTPKNGTLAPEAGTLIDLEAVFAEDQQRLSQVLSN